MAPCRCAAVPVSLLVLALAFPLDGKAQGIRRFLGPLAQRRGDQPANQEDEKARRLRDEELRRKQERRDFEERLRAKHEELDRQQRVIEQRLQQLKEPMITKNKVTGRTDFFFRGPWRPADAEALKACKGPVDVSFAFDNCCSDAALRSLRSLKVHCLGIHGKQPVSDAGFRALEKHPTMEQIFFLDLRITDAGVASIAAIPHLKHVDLWKVPITDRSLRKLSELRSLERLWLGRCPELTDNGIRHVLRMSSLKSLGLAANPRLTSGILKSVSQLKGLQGLDLDSIQLNEADLKHLPRLRNLVYLCLANTKLTDEGLRIIAQLKNLKTLVISGTKVTDAGLVHLKNLRGLEKLGMAKTQVTIDGELAFWKEMRVKAASKGNKDKEEEK